MEPIGENELYKYFWIIFRYNNSSSGPTSKREIGMSKSISSGEDETIFSTECDVVSTPKYVNKTPMIKSIEKSVIKPAII